MAAPLREIESPILSVIVDQAFDFTDPAEMLDARLKVPTDSKPSGAVLSVVVDQVIEFIDKPMGGSATVNGLPAEQGASSPEPAV